MGYTIGSLDELGEGYGFRKIRTAARRHRVRRQRARLPARLRRAGPLPRRAGRALLRPPRHGDLRRSTATSTRSAKAGSCTSSRRRTAGSRTAPTTTSSLHRRRQGRLRRARRAARQRRGPRAKRQGLLADERADDGLPADAADRCCAASEAYFGDKEIVTRLPDKSFHRYTLRETRRAGRARSRSASQSLGLERGDRVATLCWNHYQHHEAYLGIPCGGFVLHTLNLRLHPNDLAYIATHAERQGRDRRPQPAAAARAVPRPDEDRARASSSRTPTRSCSPAPTPTPGATPSSTRTRRRRCVTRAARPGCRRASSTRTARRCCTRSASPPGNPMGLGISEQDTILPVVPMFHANAWGYPYLATMIGAKLVYPGPHLDPESLLDDFVAGGRDLDGGRADDLARHPRACSTRTPSAGTSRG